MSELMRFKSHIEGKNADVAIHVDRIEWAKEGRLGTGGKLAVGAMTGGLSLLKTGVGGKSKGSEVIPISSISSVTTARDGIRFHQVSVICSGNTIDFRVSGSEAAQVKGLLTDLMLGRHPSQQVAPTPPPAPAGAPPQAENLADKLKELASLRDAGVLDDAEFAAAKAKLLS